MNLDEAELHYLIHSVKWLNHGVSWIFVFDSNNLFQLRFVVVVVVISLLAEVSLW